MPQTAPDLVVEILRKQPGVSALHVFYPILSPPIQLMPELTEDEQAIIGQALQLRSQTDFPFWDCLFQVAAKSTVDMSNLLRTAKRHNAQATAMERIERSDVLAGALAAKAQSLCSEQVLALSSKVECTDGGFMHLPMLDFHCKSGVANDRRVKQILNTLGLKGYILHSGQSYHFYGTHLIETEALVTTLACALLFAPIIDRAWIAHQLIERACGLRISSGKSYSTPPNVIDIV
jgi:hypothetical protein